MGQGGFNESQEAVLAAAVNLCVTAGAGSGKTKTLVEYIVRWLSRGYQWHSRKLKERASLKGRRRGVGEGVLRRPSVAHVLALTYTDKAAGEMRSRLAEALRERQDAAARDAAAAGGDASERRKEELFWSDEIRNLALSEIGTIHGYAFSLVRRAGWTLGLPKGLEVDKANGDADMLEALDDLLGEGNEDVRAILECVPFSAWRRDAASLVGWLRAVEARAAEWGLDRLSPGKVPDAADLRRGIADLAEVAREFREAAKNPRFMTSKPEQVREALRARIDGFLASLDGLEPPSEALRVGPEAAAALRGEFDGFKAGLSPLGYRQSMEKPNGEFKSAMESLIDAPCLVLRDPPARALREALSRLSGELKDRAFAKRRARGRVNFGDMLGLARLILRERPDLRAEEAARWKLIVVDEFQDTNRLQADTLGYILQGAADAGDGLPPPPFAEIDWQTARKAIRVFGDYKQSIYRFRGAEPSVMQGLAAKLDEADDGRGQALSLDTNYRTVPGLIGFFNAYFDAVMPGYESQKAARPAPPGSGKAVTALEIPKPKPKSKPKADADAGGGGKPASGKGKAKEEKSEGQGYMGRITLPSDAVLEPVGTQARILASYLKSLCAGKEGVKVGVKGDADAWRDPRFGDCAILLRKSIHSHVFEKALRDAGIPAHTLKGEDHFGTPAARGLACFWLALAGVERDYNLAQALLSPLGPVSDRTLELLCLPRRGIREKTQLSAYFAGEADFGSVDGEIPADELETLRAVKGLFASLSGSALRRPPGATMELAAEARKLVTRLFAAAPSGGPARVRALQVVLGRVKELPVEDRSAPDSASDLVEDLLGADNRSGEGGPEDAGSVEADMDKDEDGDDGGAKEVDDAGAPRADAVNIMTIHRSKGLEFPVVLVPEAHKGEKAMRPSLLMDDRGVLAVRVTPEGSREELSGPEYVAILESEHRQEWEEHLRIFYVAATRARDHLVLLGEAVTDSGRKSIADGFPGRGPTGQLLKMATAPWTDAAPKAKEARRKALEDGAVAAFAKAGWLHQLESWELAGDHVDFRDAGPAAYPEAWALDPVVEAVTGAGAPDGLLAGADSPDGALPAKSRQDRASASSGGYARQSPARRKDTAGGRGAVRPAMVRPLPAADAWTDTVTSYADRLVARDGDEAVRAASRGASGPSASASEVSGFPADDLADPGSLENARLGKEEPGPTGADMADREGGIGRAYGVGPAYGSARDDGIVEGGGTRGDGHPDEAVSAPIVPGRRDPDNREQGKILHAMLERTDFKSDPAAYRRMAREEAAALGLVLNEARQETLAGHAYRFQEGPTGREVREALEAGRVVWREWPFWLRLPRDESRQGPKGPVTITGVVDLFYLDADGEGVLGAYKLHRPRREAAYMEQIALYALAVRKAGFTKPVRTRLCYLSEKE
ncbi:MAG: UvrD-helicase domain-containing protein [Deltaproteobacteria bacterium]|jgi:ATP-dependent helicase/nuclease subunit A|nr:UvrD-helicase domain-containing protein [Deltaproteobacteria bacterium]